VRQAGRWGDGGVAAAGGQAAAAATTIVCTAGGRRSRHPAWLLALVPQTQAGEHPKHTSAIAHSAQQSPPGAGLLSYICLQGPPTSSPAALGPADSDRDEK
jgi:hypothetical protein